MSTKPSSLLSLDQARQILVETATPLDPVQVPLEQAGGLCLAEDVYADLDLPHWDVSAMDGYAVREKDLAANAALPVAFEVQAGDDPPALPNDSACRIFTGAVVPEGADTVVPQEQAKIEADGRVSLEALPRGSHVRRRGEVVARGAKIGERGELLTPGYVALLAAGGAAQVSVIPRPRVAVVMTGSELVDSDQQPAVGAIRDSNSPMLKALTLQARFAYAGRLTCSDDLDQTCRILEQACQAADLVVTSGGVSVGDFDFVPEAIRKLGGTILFHRISIKPGKPVLAARLGQTWVMGLPGNPVSVMVCWRLFALPLGLALAGDPSLLQEEPLRAVTTAPLANWENRTLLHPATIDMGAMPVQITPLPWKGSHDVATAAKATALIRLEAGEEIATGDSVLYYQV